MAKTLKGSRFCLLKHPARLKAWAARSRLARFVKLARSVRKRAAGILAYLDTKMTSGPVEGSNNKLRVLARRAYGFHSHGALILPPGVAGRLLAPVLLQAGAPRRSRVPGLATTPSAK